MNYAVLPTRSGLTNRMAEIMNVWCCHIIDMMWRQVRMTISLQTTILVHCGHWHQEAHGQTRTTQTKHGLEQTPSCTVMSFQVAMMRKISAKTVQMAMRQKQMRGQHHQAAHLLPAGACATIPPGLLACDACHFCIAASPFQIAPLHLYAVCRFVVRYPCSIAVLLLSLVGSLTPALASLSGSVLFVGLLAA